MRTERRAAGELEGKVPTSIDGLTSGPVLLDDCVSRNIIWETKQIPSRELEYLYQELTLRMMGECDAVNKRITSELGFGQIFDSRGLNH